MITDFKNNDYKYFCLDEPKFKTAFEFIERKDLMDLPVGRVELDNGVFVNVQEYTTAPIDTILYETHDKYFDLQYMVHGEELVGVVPREGLVNKIPYDPKEDIEFYENPGVDDGGAVLRDGYWVLLAPQDAHKPRAIAKKAEAVKKLVIKIPV